MRCSKSQILLQHATIWFHIWNRTVACCKFFYHFFIHTRSHFFSPLHSLSLSSQSSLLKTSLIYAQDLSPHHLAANLHKPRRRPPHPSLPTFHTMSLISSLYVTLYIFPLLPAQDLSPPHLVANLQSPCRRPSNFLIRSWVWDLGWVSMCGFWVIDWSVGLGLWAGGGVVVMAVVGWVLGWRCSWL